MGFLSSANVGSLSSLYRCRHPCASRPRESDSRYSWGSSMVDEALTISSMTLCFDNFSSANSKLVKLFGLFVYPQKSTWLLKSDGKQQAKSQPRHFKTCPKTLCATPCNSPETLLRESTTKRRERFHPSHFEHHHSSPLCIQFTTEIIQKTESSDQESQRKRVLMFQITYGFWRWTLFETQPNTCWCFSLLVGVGTCEDNWEDKLRFTSGWCLAVVSLW